MEIKLSHAQSRLEQISPVKREEKRKWFGCVHDSRNIDLICNICGSQKFNNWLTVESVQTRDMIGFLWSVSLSSLQ